MVNRMYWIAALVCGIFLAIILYNEILTNTRLTKREKAFQKLLSWGIIFSLQDTLWGIATCYYASKPLFIFIASTIFHSSTVIITYFWLDYVLAYLGDKVKHPNRYRCIGILIIIFQAVLLFINFFTPTIFYVNEQGQYCTAWWRMVAFYNQYIVYLITGIITAICYCRKQEGRSQYLGVTASAMAPILTGCFQFYFPYEPFYTIGYTACCVIVHMFVVSEDRKALEWHYNQELLKEKQKQLSEQKALANEDKLTGVYNRLAYEEAMQNKALVFSPDFVYASLDLNGLKNVNDTLGHAAGDELIKGAGYCLKQSLEPSGKIYRIGGDEFAALIQTDKEGLAALKNRLQETVANWQGNLVKELSISTGFVTREEYPYVTTKELAHIADTRMYKEKELYYQQKGMDRRGRSSAVTALSKLYSKIIKINLTTDSYQLIKLEESEKLAAMGFSDKISVWMHDFATSGNIYEADIEEYMAQANLENLRQYFARGNKAITINYRRRFHNEYKPTFMLIIPADDYSPNNQTCFLYVCEIFK